LPDAFALYQQDEIPAEAVEAFISAANAFLATMSEEVVTARYSTEPTDESMPREHELRATPRDIHKAVTAAVRAADAALSVNYSLRVSL
jgi:hypothetical protein